MLGFLHTSTSSYPCFAWSWEVICALIYTWFLLLWGKFLGPWWPYGLFYTDCLFLVSNLGTGISICDSYECMHCSNRILELYYLWDLIGVKAEYPIYCLSSWVWDNSFCLLSVCAFLMYDCCNLKSCNDLIVDRDKSESSLSSPKSLALATNLQLFLFLCSFFSSKVLISFSFESIFLGILTEKLIILLGGDFSYFGIY